MKLKKFSRNETKKSHQMFTVVSSDSDFTFKAGTTVNFKMSVQGVQLFILKSLY